MFKLQIKKNGKVIKSIPLDRKPTKEIIVQALKYDPNEKIQKAVTTLSKKNITDALGYEPPTTNRVNELISALVNSAPETLDTLKELADALGNDADFATTVTNALSGKLDKTATAVNASKVNNLTVETAVPANAKFTDTTYSVATTSANGLMSSTDKSKLDGINATSNLKVGTLELASGVVLV